MGLLLVFAGMACFATLFSIVFIDEIAALLGRDLTLTGRTAVWAYVVSMIEARPVLGFGYNVFFDQRANVEFLLAYLQWSVPHSHNGYLEVTLGLGVIGLALMLVLLIQSLLRAVRLVFLTNSCGAQFALVWLIVYALMNISESVMLPGAEPVWITTCVALGLLWRLGTQRRD
jgi:O-antigen ligase